jgi:hypothetical protein
MSIVHKCIVLSPEGFCVSVQRRGANSEESFTTIVYLSVVYLIMYSSFLDLESEMPLEA